MPAIILGALGISLLTAAAAVFAARTSRISDERNRLVIVFLMGLLAVEWLFLGGYFWLFPDALPSEPNAQRLLGSVIFPLLIQVPLFYSLLFLRLMRRKADRPPDQSP